MTWIDVSMPITPDMMVYKNREAKKPNFKKSASFEQNGVYETSITMNLHTGTHIDFPKHTLPNGPTSKDFDPSRLIRTVKVFDLTNVSEAIGKKDIELLSIGEDDFILFKTTNSYDEDFNFDFVYLAKDAAEYLVEQKVVGVGIDALGIERNQKGHPTHDLLLNNGIIIMEGLRLKEVEHASYEMLCLPLYIEDVEALPVRTLLKKNVAKS